MTTGDKGKLFFSNFVYALPTQQDCVLVLGRVVRKPVNVNPGLSVN